MKVSIVMPVYNEEKHIQDTLDSILHQDYSGDMELLLVDGGSTDQTGTIIADYMLRFPQIRLLFNPARIAPTAMNIGIKNATGELVIVMSAHAEYASDYVSSCVKWSSITGAENVGGPAYATGKGFWGKAIELAHYSPFGLGGAQFRTGSYEGYSDTVFGGAFRKEIFERIGYFNEYLVRNQDIEYNSRIIKAGGKCYLTPQIRSRYHCRSNLKDLWKQNYANGLWSIYTTYISPEALSLRHYIPLIFVLSLIVSGIIAVIGHFILENYFYWFAAPLFMGAGIYLIVASYFALDAAIKKGLRFFIPLIAVFATLHFSYGWGSIVGLFTVRKWARTKGIPKADDPKRV